MESFEDELAAAYRTYVERIKASGSVEGEIVAPRVFRTVLTGLDVDYPVLEGASMQSAVNFLTLVNQQGWTDEDLLRAIGGFWVQSFLMGVILMRRRVDEGRA